MRATRQPYALEVPVFGFSHLIAFAARAPLGGARETALAAYVTARLADDVLSDRVAAADRKARASGARKWLSSLAMSDGLRREFLELAAATEIDAASTAAALRKVMTVAGHSLDAASRAELDRLRTDLEAQAVARS